MRKVIAFPHSPGSGGPGSFQSRFEEALSRDNWKIVYRGSPEKPGIVMVIGGTKRIFWLLKMKISGIPVLYRLDGINWLHRKQNVGWRNYLINEYRNFTSRITHAFIADHIVYQSEFVRDWWERSGLHKRERYTIIHNGVDLQQFCPGTEKIENRQRIVCVEGTIDYSPYAVRLLNELRALSQKKIDIELYGRFSSDQSRKELHSDIKYAGPIARESVAEVLKGGVYLSLDINPACPNGVIEALAAGAPVLAFDTGALPELVTSLTGKIVAYGSDPWKLAYPDARALAEAGAELCGNYSNYSSAARKHAEMNYNMDEVMSRYMEIINKLIN